MLTFSLVFCCSNGTVAPTVFPQAFFSRGIPARKGQGSTVQGTVAHVGLTPLLYKYAFISIDSVWMAGP